MQAIIGKKIKTIELLNDVLKSKETLKDYLSNTFTYRDVVKKIAGDMYRKEISEVFKKEAAKFIDSNEDRFITNNIESIKFEKSKNVLYTDDIDSHIKEIWEDNIPIDMTEEKDKFKIRVLNLIRFTAKWSSYSSVFLNLIQEKYGWNNRNNDTNYSYSVTALTGFNYIEFYNSASNFDSVYDLTSLNHKYLTKENKISNTYSTFKEQSHLKKYVVDDSYSIYAFNSIAFDDKDYNNILNKMNLAESLVENESNEDNNKTNDKIYKWTLGPIVNSTYDWINDVKKYNYTSYSDPYNNNTSTSENNDSNGS